MTQANHPSASDDFSLANSIDCIEPTCDSTLMSSAIVSASLSDWSCQGESNSQRIANIINLILSNALPQKYVNDRRRCQRSPFPYPITMVPATRGVCHRDQKFVVIGRHLSELGIDFYHSGPIESRHLVCVFELETGHRFAFELELTRCKFNRFSIYEHVGKFIRLVEDPFAAQA